ncbi:hypothetical protein BCR33DRAFT_846805 [Rhizoclosmatium globosum]|uniref:Uncharacterized protein n=1 Tax=Rhizoclosmatium globosum TaxID=329046 RepID=A0A1Y2CTJ7_9FUNG|nr:hypothetical protein BCR33DRAFT_846805 [Rhizoclosmatium globosum]|eukprot:ORY50277.1 hypothetical protein BCR33DRAFT_846805 [Rhizoclosmatium globosum]
MRSQRRTSGAPAPAKSNAEKAREKALLDAKAQRENLRRQRVAEDESGRDERRERRRQLSGDSETSVITSASESEDGDGDVGASRTVDEAALMDIPAHQQPPAGPAEMLSFGLNIIRSATRLPPLSSSSSASSLSSLSLPLPPIPQQQQHHHQNAPPKTEDLDALFLAALNQVSEQLDPINEPDEPDEPDDFDAATPRAKGAQTPAVKPRLFVADETLSDARLDQLLRNMTRRIESEINTDDSASSSSDSSDSDDDPAYSSSVLPPKIPWKPSFASSLFPTNQPQTTSACPAAEIANPLSSTIPLNEAGVFMRSELGPLRSRAVSHSTSTSTSTQAQATQPIKSTTSTGTSTSTFTSTSTSTSTPSSYFHKQSSLPDIKPSQLSHIPLTSVADLGANIRRVLTEQLTQFHPYQSFTKTNSNVEKDAPTSSSTVTNTGSATTLVESDGEEGSGDDGMEIDDVGSVDVGVATGGKKKKKKKKSKKKKKKAAAAGAEEARVDVAAEKIELVVGLESSSEAQTVDVNAVEVPNVDLLLDENSNLDLRSESPAESIKVVVISDQEEEESVSDIQRLLISSSVPISAYADLIDELVRTLGYKLYHISRKPEPYHSQQQSPLQLHLIKTPTSKSLLSASSLKTLTKLLQSHSSKASAEQLFQVSSVSTLPVLFPPHELQKSTARVMQQRWFTTTVEPVVCVLARGGFGIPVLRALEKMVDVVGIRWVPAIPDLVARVVCPFGVGDSRSLDGIRWLSRGWDQLSEEWKSHEDDGGDGGWMVLVVRGEISKVEGVCSTLLESYKSLLTAEDKLKMEGGLSELERLQLSLLTSANIEQSYATLTYFFRDAELSQIISLDVLDDPTPSALSYSLVSPQRGMYWPVYFKLVNGGFPHFPSLFYKLQRIDGLMVSALRIINITETFARRLSEEQDNLIEVKGLALVVILHGVNAGRKVIAQLIHPSWISATPPSFRTAQHQLSVLFPKGVGIGVREVQAPFGCYQRKLTSRRPALLPVQERRVTSVPGRSNLGLCAVLFLSVSASVEDNYDAWSTGIRALFCGEAGRVVGVNHFVAVEELAGRIVESMTEKVDGVVSVYNILNGPCMILVLEGPHILETVLTRLDESTHIRCLNHEETVSVVPLLFGELNGAVGWKVGLVQNG